MLIRPIVATYLPKLFIAKELVDPHKNAGQQLRCLSHSWHPAALKIPGTSEEVSGWHFFMPQYSDPKVINLGRRWSRYQHFPKRVI